MNAQLTEIMRLITNLIRTGTVSDVDTVNWLCRVKTGDLETNWINWLTLRAGNTRTWWQPSIGELVVLLSLGCNLETAFALPAIYSDTFPPPDYSRNGSTTVFNDGGWFQFEPDTGQLLIKNIKSVRIEAADGIQLITDQLGIDARQMLINSETVMNGAVTQGGGPLGRKLGGKREAQVGEGRVLYPSAQGHHQRDPARGGATWLSHPRN